MRLMVPVVLTALLLTGCAPGTGVSDNTASDNKLTYVYFTDGPDEQATRDLIKQFEQTSGATVELQILPYADLEQQLQARLSGGVPPDVARLTHLEPFHDDLLDLKAHGQNLADQFLDAAAKHVTGPGGELLAVPSDLTLNGPFVNVDQFEQAGVPLPAADKPWTWTEMVDAAKKVQQANHTEYAIAFDKSGDRFATMLSQFGTYYFGTDGKVALDQTKATAAVSLFTDLNRQDLMSKDFWLQSGTKYKGANDIFLAKAAPVYVSGNWQVSQFAKAAPFKWAAVANPCQAQCGGFPGGKFMAAFKQSRHQDLAAKFIAFMNSQAAQRQFCASSLFLPTRKDLIASGISYPQRQQDMSVFLTDLGRTPQAAFASEYNPGYTAAANAAVKELGTAIAGQQTPAQAVDNIRKAAESSR